MKAAWDEIDSIMIRNFWVKSGLKIDPNERPAHTFQTSAPSELSMKQNQWEDFIKVDDNLEVAHDFDEDEIVDIVRARHGDEEEDVRIRSLVLKLTLTQYYMQNLF